MLERNWYYRLLFIPRKDMKYQASKLVGTKNGMENPEDTQVTTGWNCKIVVKWLTLGCK